jgi:hypothetical protein
LVTFIVCQFVTAAGITEILGCDPAGFRRSSENPRMKRSKSGFAALRHSFSARSFDCAAGFPD